MQIYQKGDILDLEAMGANQKGKLHRGYHGKVGQSAVLPSMLLPLL